MPFIAKLRAICLTTTMAIAAGLPALAQEACTTYTVAEGDTLGSISNTAYGTYDYQQIFNANRDVIAASPNALPAGTQLTLPCLDGRLRPDQELNSITERETREFNQTRVTTGEYTPAIRVVAGDGWPPFTDSRLQEGGLLTRLGLTAFSRGGNDRDAKLDWVDDWGSHLDVLLPSRAFDLSIGWDGIDCSKMDLLSPDMVRRCTELVLSDPVYEVVYGFYSLPENPFFQARSFADLQGARICRPADWATADLEVEGLSPPAVTYVQPTEYDACVQLLLDGEADVMSIEIETAVYYIELAKVTDRIVQNPYLIKIASLHFATHVSNERGKEYLTMLNAGLAEMRETGEWYDIVASSLIESNNLPK
jgi:ABC-type amino acid transport substrate-binding protein/phage tail protein X